MSCIDAITDHVASKTLYAIGLGAASTVCITLAALDIWPKLALIGAATGPLGATAILLRPSGQLPPPVEVTWEDFREEYDNLATDSAQLVAAIRFKSAHGLNAADMPHWITDDVKASVV